jgi:hypothetical protein
MKCFRVPGSGVRLNPTETHDGPKRVFRKPLFIALRLEIFYDLPYFLIACIAFNLDEEIRRTDISIVFGDFVLQNQVVAVCVPGQFIDQSMVLMQITSKVCENKIRGIFQFHLLEIFLYFLTLVGEKPIPEILYRNIFFLYGLQERFCACDGFPLSIRIRTEYDPFHAHIFPLLRQFQYRSATTDFDIVAMGAKKQYLALPILFTIKFYV